MSSDGQPLEVVYLLAAFIVRPRRARAAASRTTTATTTSGRPTSSRILITISILPKDRLNGGLERARARPRTQKLAQFIGVSLQGFFLNLGLAALPHRQASSSTA